LNLDEDGTIEMDLSSYDQHPHSEETSSAGKKPLLLTKWLEKEPNDIENMVKLVRKLSNEVVYLKKNVDEGYSRPITFYPFFKKNNNPPIPPEAPQVTLNINISGKYNQYSYHQKNHSEKTCP